jgi:nucleoid-associated protein YgaU
MATVLALARLSEAVYETDKGALAAPVQGWEIIKPFGNPKSGFYAVLFKQITNKEPVLAIRGTDFTQGSDLGADAQLAVGSVPHQLEDAEGALKLALSGLVQRSLYVTGHSLGGGLASLLGARHHLPTVTFNAPGMQNSYVSLVAGASPASLAGLGMLATQPMAPFPVMGAPSMYASQQMMEGIQKRQQAATSVHTLDTSKMLNIRASGDQVSVRTGPAIGRVESITVSEGHLNGWQKAAGIIVTPVGVVQAGNYVFQQHRIVNVRHALEGLPKYQVELSWLNPPAPPVAHVNTIPGRTQRVHVVAAGDTLSRIATKYYGDAKKWPAIYALPANKAQIGPNPNTIRPGLRLLIP